MQKRLSLNNLFLFFKHYITFFNINKEIIVEHLEAICLIGQICGPFLLFTLYSLSEHSHIYTGLIFLIAQNLAGYLHFVLFLFVWLFQPKYVPYPSHHYNYFSASCAMMKGWKEEPGSPELLKERLKLDGGTSNPSSYYETIKCSTELRVLTSLWDSVC